MPERVIGNHSIERFIREMDIADVRMYQCRLWTPQLRLEKLLARDIDADSSVAAPYHIYENRRAASTTKIKHSCRTRQRCKEPFDPRALALADRCRAPSVPPCIRNPIVRAPNDRLTPVHG